MLSVQRALLGEVTPAMRAVAVELTPGHLRVRVYTDGESTAEARLEFDLEVMSEVLADFPWPEFGSPEISLEFVRHDPPARLPAWGWYVYARAERGAGG